MPSYSVGRHAVATTHRQLSDYMLGLAVSLAARFGFQPGRKFLSDVFNVMKNDASAFPSEIGTFARRMRLERLLDTPVQVDDLVLTLETDVQEKKYQKTKHVVVTRGSLPPGVDGNARSAEAALPVATYVDRHVAAFDPAGCDPIVLRRLDALEKSFADLRADVLTQLSGLHDVLIIEGVVPEALTDCNTRYQLAGNLDILRRRVDALAASVAVVRRESPPAPTASMAPARPLPTFATPTVAVPQPTPPAPVGALDWPPDGATTQWHARPGAPRLSRPRFVLLVESYEKDLTAALAALGQMPRPHGVMVEPEGCLRDCAARAIRAYGLSSDVLLREKLEPVLPVAAMPAHPAWTDVGAALALTDAGLRRLREKFPNLWERRVHPELVEPEDER